MAQKQSKDGLGDRIKSYERVGKTYLTPKTPVMIRVDGKAFHTFTRGCEKPYDQNLIDAMAYATQMTAKEMSGFELAYTQSDEATFLIQDYAEHETQGWFGYELDKIVSITASAFTAHFNAYWYSLSVNSPQNYVDGVNPKPPMFDARAFNIPREDAPNAFIWRQRDWERNSIQMLARSRYSQKELHGISMYIMLGKLELDGGKKWTEYGGQIQRGTFVERDGTLTHERETWESINARLLNPS